MLKWEGQGRRRVTVSLNKPNIAKPVSGEMVNLTQLKLGIHVTFVCPQRKLVLVSRFTRDELRRYHRQIAAKERWKLNCHSRIRWLARRHEEQ